MAGTDRDRARKVLQRRPLLNTVMLKYLPVSVVHQIEDGPDVGTLILVDNQRSAYDRKTYPDIRHSAIITSDRPDLTRALLAHVPRDEPVMIKLNSEADREVVEESFALDRKNAFFSYSAAEVAPLADPATILTSPQGTPFDLFETAGHAPDWLRGELEAGRAFAVTTTDEPLSGCFAFAIDPAVWEVGGVYTRPEARGKGLARRVVHTALTELKRRGHLPRYQVAEANLPSIRLAESVGMRRFLTLTHYLGTAR